MTRLNVGNIRHPNGTDDNISLNSLGQVGINNSSPDDYLTIANTGASGDIGLRFKGDASSRQFIMFGDPGGIQLGDIMYDHGTDAMRFRTNNTERLRIDSSGRLLVGTSSAPTAPTTLVLKGNSGSTNTQGRIHIQRAGAPGNGDFIGDINFMDTSDGVAGFIGVARDGGTWTAGSSTPGRLVFSTTADGTASPTERMTITSSGQTYWESASPGLASFGTSIGRSGLVGFFETFRNVNATGSVVIAGGNVGYARILGDGDLENTNNRYTGISDIKFKQNIENASSQWDDIKAIQVRKYELIANPDRKHIGVIAQELEQVCPGLVIERNEDDEGTETYKSVAYSVLYMKAVKALQEAMERIEQLESEMAAVKAQLS